MSLTATTYNPALPAPSGGSSNVQQYLSSGQHTSWLAATGQTGTPAAAWRRLLRDLVGGAIAYNRETQSLYNEAGTLITDTTSTNEMVINNSVIGTDAVTIMTLEWMENNDVPMRYPLPLKADGTFEVDVDGHLHGQLWYFPQVRARKTNRTIPTTRGTQRAMEFQLVASLKAGESRVFYVADVDLDDESEWPDILAGAANTPGSPLEE